MSGSSRQVVRLDADWPARLHAAPRNHRAAARSRSAPPRLCHLHLRFNRNAQGRGGDPRRLEQLPRCSMASRSRLPRMTGLLAVTTIGFDIAARGNSTCRCSAAPRFLVIAASRKNCSMHRRCCEDDRGRLASNCHAGDADAVAVAAGRWRLAEWSDLKGLAHAHRRRAAAGGALARTLKAPMAATPHQSLWPDRDHDLVLRVMPLQLNDGSQLRADEPADRSSDLEHASLTSWTASLQPVPAGLPARCTSRPRGWRAAITIGRA